MPWRREAVVAVWILAFSAALGAVAGLVWSALAEHIPIHALLTDSETADKALIGQDLTFAYVTATAGVLVVGLALALTARHQWRERVVGPGASIGLALGGVAGAWIADLVGKAQRDPAFSTALHRLGPHLPQLYVDLELAAHQFQLRALGLLLVWPLLAVAVHAVAARASKAGLA
jgi:hypothetical protein